MGKVETDVARLQVENNYISKMLEKLQTTLENHIEREYKDKEELKEFVAEKIEAISENFVHRKEFEERLKKIHKPKWYDKIATKD